MARQSAKAKAKGGGLFPVHEATLKNGLKVRISESRDIPVVAVYTFFRVGSRNERPGITGISHLFEHMMFNGAKRYGPKEFDRVLESHGGHSNAYTTTDMTVYHDEATPEALEVVLDLEADRMASLSITPRTLESERDVVMEERRVRVDNDIPGMMDEELGALAFKAHPYRWPVIGWMKDIQNITRADCEAYFRTYYAPNNAVLYVVGDVDREKTLKLIQRYYGGIPRGPDAPTVLDAEPEPRGERRAQIRHPAQAPAVMIGYRAPRAGEPDAYALDVLQYALTVGEGSLLTRELVYRQEVAIACGVDWGWRLDPGLVIVSMDLKPGAEPEQVEQRLYAELEKVARDGVDGRVLQKAKNNLKAHLLREMATASSRANALGTYELLLGSWRAQEALAERYQAVSAGDVQGAARRYFAPERRSVVTVIPSGESPPEPGGEGES
ncbi:MAG TPA: pitrilysin family protein [Myxococcaceae bacterium]|jgi:predicted Zn-dependent peptidase